MGFGETGGVSLTTEYAQMVRVVPHMPDTMGPLPKTEERKDDGTFTANVECLVAYVGEIEVRIDPAGLTKGDNVRLRPRSRCN